MGRPKPCADTVAPEGEGEGPRGTMEFGEGRNHGIVCQHAVAQKHSRKKRERMRCANCQHDNLDDFRFCMRCGTRLEHICPACGASLPPESLFCGKCGVRLPSDTSPPPLAT